MHRNYFPAMVPLVFALALGACEQSAPTADSLAADRGKFGGGAVRHVLLISVDGMHDVDLERFVSAHPSSALARLSRTGTTFSSASTSKPSDSYPGLTALITGGTPKSTGVYYDDSYDRNLSAPGSDCSVRGAEIVYDETVDFDLTRLDAGGGINPANLPLDPDNGCTPVYPHSFLRVNTIFEVIHAAGLRTAWSDKHPSYDLVNGPSGHGVDDLFNPEVAANLPIGGTAADNVANCEYYDDIKVAAILNEIDGFDHTGTTHVGVPAIFGMNFQSVSVGQKTTGYLDAAGTPTPDLANALAYVDKSIGKFVDALDANGLLEHTLIIVGAKHGQSPIDPSQRHIVSSKIIPNIVNGISPGLLAQGTQDDVALLWLTDQTQSDAVQTALLANTSTDFVQSVLEGAPLIAMFGDPTKDSRTPDVIANPVVGVIYTKLTATKTAEHGGFSEPDTHAALLLAGHGFHSGKVNSTPVTNTQVAPTILEALGLNPGALQAVVLEGTAPLPGSSN